MECRNEMKFTDTIKVMDYTEKGVITLVSRMCTVKELKDGSKK